MTRVLHLIDDVRLGGITRTLDLQCGGGVGDFRMERAVVNPDRPLLPPLGEAEVVIVHFTLAWRKFPFILRLRAACRGRRLVLAEHSYTAAYEQRCVRSRGRFRLMLRLGMSLFDKVVAVSHGQARWLLEAGLLPADRLAVIQPTSDITAFAHVPPLRPHRGPLRLGSYGRYAPQKGLFTLVEAMRLLPPGLATLQLAGYGPDEAALRAAAEGVPGIEIGGRIDKPEHFLAGIDAVVMPSLWEAYGQVCAESRAAGRPILVADLDGLSEQVPAALRIPGPSAEAIAERIRWLAAQDLPALGESLRPGVAGTVERHCTAWNMLLRQLLATPAPPVAGPPTGNVSEEMSGAL